MITPRPSIFSFVRLALVRAFPLFALMALLFSGCATTDAPPSNDYEAVTPSANTASIIGSRLPSAGLFDDNHYGFVLMFDRKLINDAEKYWQKPLIVEEGRHELTVEYHHSNFISRATFSFHAAAGMTYQVMIKPVREGTDQQQFVDFWLADSSGKAVTDVYHRNVTGGQTGSIFRP